MNKNKLDYDIFIVPITGTQRPNHYTIWGH